MTHIMRHTEACPVCAMPVRTRGAQHTLCHEGRMLYFCSPACREKFAAMGARPRRGRWRRFLDRLARANEREFGGGGAAGACAH